MMSRVHSRLCIGLQSAQSARVAISLSEHHVRKSYRQHLTPHAKCRFIFNTMRPDSLLCWSRCRELADNTPSLVL